MTVVAEEEEARGRRTNWLADVHEEAENTPTVVVDRKTWETGSARR